jgi:urease accessory protein
MTRPGASTANMDAPLPQVDLPISRAPSRIGIGGPVGTGKTTLVSICAPCVSAIHRWSPMTFIRVKMLMRWSDRRRCRQSHYRCGNRRPFAYRDLRRCSTPTCHRDIAKPGSDLDLILIESGGDNLAATFSPELADLDLCDPWCQGDDILARVAPPSLARSAYQQA